MRSLATVAVALTMAALVGCTSETSSQHGAADTVATSSSTGKSETPGRTSPASRTLSPGVSRSPATPARSRPAVTASRSVAPSSTRARSAGSLPLALPVDSARQVITVTADSASSTTAILQAWRRVGGGWRPVGSQTQAWVGSAGLSRHPSESQSATPMGSFTLTTAFGRERDPGAALPYTRTTPDDWWISQPGSLYNTRQRCAVDCAFTRGAPNEHLYYETPYYDFALVIDYNTANAPGGVRQGAGSAFFLHVTVGQPTQGCVSIAKSRLVELLRWLRPTSRPRILIGVRRP